MRVDIRALTALYVGAVFIAFSPILVRLSELQPVATAFHRTFLAVPLLAVWAWLDQRSGRFRVQQIDRPAWLWLLATGFLFAGDLAVWHWSIALTSVANATLLANLAPIVVTALAWVGFGEQPTRNFLAGLVLAIAGVIMLMRTSLFAGAGNLSGDLLGLLTAVFYGAYIITVKHLRVCLPTSWLMLGVSLVTSVFLCLVAVGLGESLLPLTLRAWLILAALAWISQVAGQSLIVFALAHLRASYSSVVLLLQPVVAALLAWLWFAERLTGLQALGALIVLAGIWMAQNGSRSRLKSN